MPRTRENHGYGCARSRVAWRLRVYLDESMRYVTAFALALIAAAVVASVAAAQGMKDLLGMIGWEYMWTFDNPHDLDEIRSISVFQVGNNTVVANGMVYNLNVSASPGFGAVALLDARVEVPSRNITLVDQAYDVLIVTSRGGDVVLYYAPAGSSARVEKILLGNTTVTVHVVSAGTILYAHYDIRMRALAPVPPGYNVIFRGRVCNDRWLGPYNWRGTTTIYFDETHDNGDIDLRVFAGCRSWSCWQRTIFADLAPQSYTFNFNRDVYLQLHRWFGCSNVIVAVRGGGGGGSGGDGGGSGGGSGGGGSHTVTVTQTVTRTQTVTQTQTVTHTVTQPITITQPQIITVTHTVAQPVPQPVVITGGGGQQQLGGAVNAILPGLNNTALAALIIVIVVVAVIAVAAGRR